MRADDESDNAEWIRQISYGDESSFSILCAKYEAGLLSYVLKRVTNREDAEEIVQDAFVRVARNLETL